MNEHRITNALAGWLWRWRIPLSIFIVLGALGLAPRANITRIDNDITAWFSKEDPVYKDYERFRREFGGTRTLIVALQADSPDRLFSRDTLAFIERVTGDIERVDTVHRVDSLATATIVEALKRPDEDGGLEVRPLLDDATRQSPDDVRRLALDDDLLRGDIVSENGTVTAIVVSFDEDRIDAVRGGVIQRIHDLVDPNLPAGIRAHYNGSLEISETYNRITLDNQMKFTPPILVFTILAIFAAFRSWRKTMLAMFAILISIFWTLGLYSLMGFSYNVLSSMLVPLVVVLAIADDVHIMQRWDEARRHEDDETAFKETVSHLVTPLFGASATTALGMLSLATSNVVAVRSFGIGSAVGIMVDFVISLILVPTLLTYVKASSQASPNEQYLVGPLRRVAKIACAYPVRVLSVALIVCLVAAVGIVRLKVDTNHINFFAASHPLGQSARIIDQELSGVYSFQLMLEGPPDSLNTPDALQRIDRLQTELRAFDHVRKVTSIVDYVKRINRVLNDGRPEANVVPSDASLIAQELFVFALGGEGRHELERVVASDYSRAQINVKLQSMSSDVVLRHVEDADRMAKETFAGTGIAVLTTGSGRLFSTLDHYLVSSQVSSFGTAFLTVFAVIFLVFRSWRFGALTIVPNVLPVIAVLGVMGFLDISMNIATVMVASVALGVVDDDTIHFINRYRREVSEGASTDEAIERATIHEGRASLTTAIINSCGFAVLFLSEYKPTAWFGGLLALTMAVAFLAEVLILPPIIKLMPRVFGAEALRRPAVATALAIAALLGFGGSAQAQTVSRPTGNVSAFVDWFPNAAPSTSTPGAGPDTGSPTRNTGAQELRARLFVEQKIHPSTASEVVVSGFVEGLLARRVVDQIGRDTVTDAIARVHEATASLRLGRFELYGGYGRIVWGRLDELQPTDVINPLDVSRFFFEGRSEARLPVAVIRGRFYFTDDVSVEGVYVPVFRRGRFDQQTEPSSPFNIAPALRSDVVVCLAIGCPTLAPRVEEIEPSTRLNNAQGGARFNATIGRLDWSLSAYRGFESFPMLSVVAAAPPVITAVHPRFTMIGGDFETVAGAWAMRGEVAAFIRDNFQTADPAVVGGRSFDAGLGVDRKAGDYQLSGTVLVHREEPDSTPFDTDPDARSDVSFIVSTDRTFARERYG
ncbi:MAG: RND family transporter, partial [Acidobacteria bacterium]|nr:RND family transporter [Acidobacteriota bacterium]